jgi:hypothetical protein
MVGQPTMTVLLIGFGAALGYLARILHDLWHHRS